MSGDAGVLAQRFADALQQLQSAWDLQYVGAGSVPEPMTEATFDPVVAEATEDGGVEVIEPREAAPRAAEPRAAEPRAAEPEAPAVSAPPATPSLSSPAGPGPAPEPRTANPPASTSTDGPTTIADPVQRAEAARARKEALREQAQRWSPATKLEYLRRHNLGDCRRCPLARTRNNIVFGVGNAAADLMFVGEAPGAEEDRVGEPFVGRAGQLLNRWLVELGMKRDDVYIANVLKCRPPGNRDPKPEEVDRCSPFLQAQIRAIEPKVIVALGRHAGMLLSRREDMTLRAMRSTSRLSYDAGAPKDDPNARIRIPLVVTYHPAYVLRQEGDGRPPPAGRPSPTSLVMTDLRRALSIAGVPDTGGAD